MRGGRYRQRAESLNQKSNLEIGGGQNWPPSLFKLIFFTGGDMVRRLILLVLLAIPLMMSSCVSTSLVYNPHIYHDGRSIPSGRTQVQLAAASMPGIFSEDNYPPSGAPTVHSGYGGDSRRWFGVNGGVRH
jgi:hypothetical protein